MRAAKAVTRPRLLMHWTMLAGVALIVMASRGTSSHTVAVSLIDQPLGIGSTLDQTTVADVAANLASSANLLVSADANRQANTLNQEVDLPTADSTDLAKRQVVSTAGDATRGVTSYAVQPGDTLSQIAAKFNITTDTLAWANNLSDADSLSPGQQLTILPISGLLYTVAAGDTADSLATKYQANAAQILSYNNAEVKGLQVGSKVIIPDGVQPAPPKPAVTTPARATYSAPSLTYFAYSGNGYAFGYCTWYVASRRNVPSFWGNAIDWYYNAQISGFSVGYTPAVGAIAWQPSGYYGHVAYVESVSGGMVTVSEMNFNGNWDRVTYRTVPASTFRYIY